MVFIIDFITVIIAFVISLILYIIYYRIFVIGYMKKIIKLIKNGEHEKAKAMKDKALKKQPVRVKRLIEKYKIEIL